MYGDILTGLHLDSMLEVLGLTSTPQYECRPSLSQSYPLDGHTCGTGYDQTTNRWLRIRPCCLQLNNNKNNWLHIFALRNACKKNCPFTVFRLDVSSPICPLYIPWYLVIYLGHFVRISNIFYQPIPVFRTKKLRCLFFTTPVPFKILFLEWPAYGILFPNLFYKLLLVPHLDVWSRNILKPTHWWISTNVV